MRLHHLGVTAFGPFADTTSVDFDALSGAGLFLLTGPTGAGKTSVLDAVCFALYGEVPGDRQAAKRLRADQAAAGVAPEVTLELSLGGRRFRIVRSPAWERPKKRGTGTTAQQASVRFSEHGEAGWHLLSNRLDETGHLVTHLVGMNLPQFCQVAMLPQGRFQAFLRARSEERHKLLQQLFRTTRFEDIERWLRDRRRGLRLESGRHHELVSDLVSRISETADVPPPDAWDLHELAQPSADGSLARWSGGHRGAAATAATSAATRASRATYDEHTSRAALDQARRLVEAQATHAAALAARDRLAAGAPDHALRIDRVAAARRAATVLPLHRVAAEQTEIRLAAADRCSARTSVAARSLDADPTLLDRRALVQAQRQAQDSAAAVRALLPRETTLARVREAMADASSEIEELEGRLASMAEELEQLPVQIDVARTAHAAALDAVQQLVPARVRVTSLHRQADATRLVASLTDELAEARTLLADAVDLVQHRKEVWLHLQEERINGMAAEIAGALAVGADCPVCGSVEHPRLAPARPGAPDAKAEKAARRLVDDAEATRHAHEGLVRDLTTRIAVAREQAGEAGSDIDGEIAAAESEARRLDALAARVAQHAAGLATLERTKVKVVADRETILVSLTANRSALTARQEEAEGILRELASVLDDAAAETLTGVIDREERIAAACEAALTAVADLEAASAAEAQAGGRAGDAAVAAGFPDVESAVAAALGEKMTSELDRAIRAHEAATATADTVLADPALRAAASVSDPDLVRLESSQQACEAELATARTSMALGQARAQRLAGLDSDLRAALAAWAPVRDDLDQTTRLAALADGTSADNRLQMRLSGYVLAWRLSQVVAAANQRLARMSDQRYSLEHTGRRGAGETRGGLSLLVRDDWSGETRDPATLSGGETFVVSLALALGLADVIAHEVGGADLDTLFVDEGFGSLDADTLDDVMDTLDSLRDGGRVVGVVSHVAEMRDRIPVQLRVTKSRLGSSLSLSH